MFHLRRFTSRISIALSILVGATTVLPTASTVSAKNLDVLSSQFTSLTNSSSSTSQVSTLTAPFNDEQRVIISFKEDMDPTLVTKAKGKLKKEFKRVSALSATLPANEIEELKKNPKIKRVEPDTKVQVASQTIDRGTQQIQAPLSWSRGYTGQDIKVAVIDSGISLHHEDLVVTGGASFVDYTSSYEDDFGHGTHVAGIIGAKHNDLGVVGVAPDANLYAVKALDSTGSGYLSDIISGIEWSIENHMDIVNMSISMPTDSEIFRNVLDGAYQNGVLLVAAAGNTGLNGLHGAVQYPAQYASVIAVGAVDALNQYAAFSAMGSKIEVVAPGVNINSTTLNNNYTLMSGTSMASPFVAGKLALLKQANPSLANNQIRELLDANVMDLGTPGRDDRYGYGLIQDTKSVGATVPVENPGVTDNVYQPQDTLKMDDPNADPDGDGLTNGEEKLYGTSNQEIDSDHDGISDYEEVKIHNTNPTDVDTDKDHLFDGIEINELHTNPIASDENKNGVPDGDEDRTFPIKENEFGITGYVTGKGAVNRKYGIFKNPFIILDYMLAVTKVYIQSSDDSLTFHLNIPISIDAKSKIKDPELYKFNSEQGSLLPVDKNISKKAKSIEVDLVGEAMLVVASKSEFDKTEKSKVQKSLKKQNLKTAKPEGKLYVTNIPGLTLDAKELMKSRSRKDKQTGETVIDTNKLVFERQEYDPTSKKVVTKKAYYKVDELYSDGSTNFATLQATSMGTGVSPTIMIHGYNDSIDAWGFEQVWDNIPPWTANGNTANYIYTKWLPTALRSISSVNSFTSESYSNGEESSFNDPNVQYLHQVIDYAQLGPQLIDMGVGYKPNETLFGFTYRSKYPHLVADAATNLNKYIEFLKGYTNPKTGQRYIKEDDEINLLTHSTGGLVARYFVENIHNDGLIDRVVAIAPPNYGSELANGDWFPDGTSAARDLDRKESCLWKPTNYECLFLGNNATVNINNGTAGQIHVGKTKYYFIGGFNPIDITGLRKINFNSSKLESEYWVYPSETELISEGYNNYHDYTIRFLESGNGNKFTPVKGVSYFYGFNRSSFYSSDIADGVVDVDSAMGSDQDPDYRGNYPFISAAGRYMFFDDGKLYSGDCGLYNPNCSYSSHSLMRKHPAMLYLVSNLLNGFPDETKYDDERYNRLRSEFAAQQVSGSSVIENVYSVEENDKAHSVTDNVYTSTTVADNVYRVSAAAVGSLSSPIIVNSQTPQVYWVQSDAYQSSTSSNNFTAYELNVFDSVGNEVWYSSPVTQNTSSRVGTGRITQTLQNGSLYQVSVSIRDKQGVWSKVSNPIWIKVDTAASPTPWPIPSLAPQVSLASPSGSQSSPTSVNSQKPTIAWTSNKNFSQFIVQIYDEYNNLAYDSGLQMLSSPANSKNWTVESSNRFSFNSAYRVLIRIYDGTEWNIEDNSKWFKITPPPKVTLRPNVIYPYGRTASEATQLTNQPDWMYWEVDAPIGDVISAGVYIIQDEQYNTVYVPEEWTTFTAVNSSVEHWSWADHWAGSFRLPQGVMLPVNKKLEIMAVVTDWYNDGACDHGTCSKWFEIKDQVPQVTLTNITGSATAPTVVATTKPTITWTQSDGDGLSQLKTFQVQVINADGTYRIIDSGEILQTNPTSTMSWILQSELPNNQNLKVRVRVSDGITWSNWAEGWLTVRLLLNSSFENGTSDWSINNANGGSALIDTTIKNIGNQSLKVTVAPSGDQYQYQTIDFGTEISGRQFTVSAYLKTAGIVGNGVRALIYWQDINGQWIWSNNSSSILVTGTTDWKRLEATGIAPYGASKVTVIIVPKVNGQGVYWVDDVAIKEAPSRAVILPNPSFENGLTDVGYYVGAGSISADTTNFNTGKQSMKVTLSTNETWQFETKQLGSDIAGRKFTVSAYIKTANVPNGVQLRIYWVDSTGNFIWSNITGSTYLAGNNEWTKLSATSVAPYGATGVAPMIVGFSGSGAYWIDSLEAIEESSTSVSLPNPSFENGLTDVGYYVGAGSISADTTNFNTGKQSLKVTLSTNETWQFETKQLGSDIAGRKFTVSAYIKTANVPNGVQLRIYWVDSTGNFIWSNITGSTYLAGNNEWTKLSATSVAPYGATGVAPMIVGFSGSGSYWIDSLEAIEESSNSLPFPNASFENGLTDVGYYVGAGSISADTTNFNTGKQSMKVTLSTNETWQFETKQLGSDIAGRKFTVSAYIKTANVPNGVQLRIYWVDSTGNFIWSNITGSTYLAGNNEWTKLSATSVAPYGATGVAPMIVGFSGSGAYWIDSLEAIEESSTSVSLPNPSFENGLTDVGYYVGAGSISADTTNFNTGKQSLKVTLSTNETWQFETKQLGSDIAGRKFTVSAYIKTANVPNGVQLRIYWVDSTGNFIWSNITGSTYLAGNNEWTKLSATSVAPYGTTGVAPMIVGFSGSGAYWIDSLEILEE
ncbi:S8 family serine peptidase [Paenibacillus sp. LjRoot153]|uniref:S8 family serine peptidase n=1 Tax=Paenibacillus sp. LjRoot153 TaxID=3342270 RepID=UPI003ED137D5